MLLAVFQAVLERFRGFSNTFMLQSQNPVPQNPLFISLARLAGACQGVWVSEMGLGSWSKNLMLRNPCPTPPKETKTVVVSPSFVVQWPQS